MPGLPWLNANANRSFPFLAGGAARPGAAAGTVEALADEVVVDAGFLVGLNSGHDPAADSIWLDHVSRTGDAVTLVFAGDAPGLAGRPLAFTFDVAAENDQTVYAESFTDAAGESETSDSLFDDSSESAACTAELLWGGYVVAGRLASVPQGLSTRSSDGGVVEPALVQSLAGGYVDSINLANADRTRVTPPAGCDSVDWGFPVGAGRLYVAARCLRGDVKFKPGYSVVVRQETDANQLVLGAEPGAGAGPACEEVALFADEAPPPGSGFLEGGPACNTVLRTINGSGGRFAAVLGGLGVRVSTDPDRHTVVVDVNGSRLAACPGEGFSEVSESV